VSEDPLVGTTLDGRYRILRVIGEGGMGVVYEALHVLIEKHVAIKVLRDTFTGRVDVVERFRQEAKSASKIGHPNIVDVSDFGETPSGQSYIVMEMLIGEDLADVLARERALSPTRAVRIAYQIARALHATHKKNIVHRDLKPENIYLVQRDGAADVVKIVDFGVAKMNDVEVRPGRRLTRTGMLFGTPEYMSPEQALGKPFDHRVDIYALGAILFELLAGRVPFTGENFMEILAHHGRTPLPSLRSVSKHVQVSAELEAVIARALAKEPEGRHASMGVFADELRAVPEMLGVSGVNSPDMDFGAHGEWPSLVSRDVYGPKTPQFVSERSYEPRYDRPAPVDSPPPPPPRNVQQDQTPFAVPSPQARPPRVDVGHRASDDVDLTAHDAVLLSPGAELRSSAKVGLALVVLASALLGVFVLQQSTGRPGLRSLPSVHGNAASAELPDPPADGDERAQPVGQEQSTQAATAAPAQPGAYADSLPAATTPSGPSLQRLAADARASEAQVLGNSHARSEGTRHASTSHPEPGLEASVEVTVRTVPRGASVAVLGTDARCEPAPCALLVPKDRAVTLRAEARNTSVQKTFTFVEESEVELRLSGRKPSSASTPESEASSVISKPVQPPHAPSDLKVPSIFR
jgi:serine/threonine protein kinase